MISTYNISYFFCLLFLFVNVSNGQIILNKVIEAEQVYGLVTKCPVTYTISLSADRQITENDFSWPNGTTNTFSAFYMNYGPNLNNQIFVITYNGADGNNIFDILISSSNPTPQTAYFALKTNYFCQLFNNYMINPLKVGASIYSIHQSNVYNHLYLNMTSSLVGFNYKPYFSCQTNETSAFQCTIKLTSVDDSSSIGINLYPIANPTMKYPTSVNVQISVNSVGFESGSFISEPFPISIDLPLNINRTTTLVNTKVSPAGNSTYYQNFLEYTPNIEYSEIFENMDSFPLSTYNDLPVPLVYNYVGGNSTHKIYTSGIQNLNIQMANPIYQYYCDTNCTRIGSPESFAYITYPSFSLTTNDIVITFNDDIQTNSTFFESTAPIPYIKPSASMYTSSVSELTYPFGYVNKTNIGITSITSKLVQGNFMSTFYTVQNNIYISPDSPTPTIPVEITDLEIFPLDSFNIFYRFTLKSTLGVIRIRIQSNTNDLEGSYLVSGDQFNGVYEFVMVAKSGYKYLANLVGIYVYYETLGNTNTNFISGNIYNTSLSTIPTLNIYDYTLSDIIYFQFEHSLVDMSNGGDFENTLWISFKNNLPDLYFYLDVSPFLASLYQDSTSLYQSEYDSHRNMFRVDFIMTKCLPGVQNYLIAFPKSTFYWNDIYTEIGNNASLTVVNSVADYQGPRLTGLKSLYGNNQNINLNENRTIGWDLSISDYPNGFLNGTVTILSEKDLEPIILNFNETARISGDKYNGVYQISFQVNGDICRSQTLIISDIKLYDQYPAPVLNTNYKDRSAFIDILGTNDEQNLNVTITCQETVDNDLPKLESLLLPSTIDVGASDRTFEAIFSISDVGSGVSERHLPYLYIISESKANMKIQSTLLNYTKSLAYYSAKAQLPFGLGFRNMIVSIYGIYDNYLNMKGYSTNDLKQAGFSYSFNRTQSFIDPIVESCSTITKKGGPLFIFGHNFGSPSTFQFLVNYRNGSNWVTITPFFQAASVIQIKNIDPITSDYIQAKIIVDSVESNIFDIYPLVRIVTPPNPTTSPSNTPSVTPSETPTTTPSVTPNPIICPGTPVCNGQGECLSSGCKCKDPWYGPSCSSKLNPIIVPPPAENPTTEFNITNPQKPNQYFTAKISVISVLEMDNNNQVANRFNLTQWKLLSSYSNENRTSYKYSCVVGGRSTIVNTTIDFFMKETNVSFAGGDIQLNPFSVKFTIDVDHYDFVSQLHTMQVVMEASISSSDSDVCSSKMIGSETNDNVQWIKINIDDNALFGRFLDRAMVDDRNITVTNLQISDDSVKGDTFNTVTTRIGIVVPYYERNIIIDPDFSSLVDIKDDGSSKTCEKKKKGLSAGSIAAIAVCSFVFAASVTIGSIIFIRKQKRLKKQNEMIQKKLSQLNK